MAAAAQRTRLPSLPSRPRGSAEARARLGRAVTLPFAVRSPRRAAPRARRSLPPSAAGPRRASISPLRASQYFAGAGLGSANSSRVRSEMPCQRASAASRSPCLQQRAHRGEASVSMMRRQQDGAVGAVGERLVILRVLAGQDPKAGRPPAKQVDRLRAVGAAILQADDVRMLGELQQRLVGEVDRGPVGNVVEHDRPRGVIGERGEMLQQAALRRPRCSRGSRSDSRRSARPRSRPACRASSRCWRRTARGRSAGSARCRTARRAHRDDPLEFGDAERHAFARGRREDQSVDRAGGIVPDQPAQRRLVEFAVAERRDERQPEALQLRSKVSHGPSPLGGEPETGPIKNPVQTAGFWGSVVREVYRARRSPVPGRGPFFDDSCARIRDHVRMMMAGDVNVNPRNHDRVDEHDRERRDKKKPGSKEPGLRYWPREADTITFQEGLLNFRATGGGGHMRNANAQRGNTMIPVGALQQPPKPHVRHAETGG